LVFLIFIVCTFFSQKNTNNCGNVADADGEYTYSYQYEEISGDEGQDNAEQQGTEMKPVETEPAANVSETESYETDSDEDVEAEEKEETETETEESTDSDETK